MKMFLQEIDEVDAQEIWEWLDGNPEALYELIEVVASRSQKAEFQGERKREK